MGEVPAAGVVLRPGARTTPEALTAWAENRLASHKVPRTIRIIDEVPRTPTHKVKRSALAAILADG